MTARLTALTLTALLTGCAGRKPIALPPEFSSKSPVFFSHGEDEVTVIELNRMQDVANERLAELENEDHPDSY